jgi:CRISPR type III-A-associated protein Csm2
MAYNKNSIDVDWIKSKNGLNDISINWAKEFGEFLAQDESKGLKMLSTSQIRKFFGQLKRIKSEGYSEVNRTKLLMLKPHLAYAVGRDKNQTKVKFFSEEITKGIDNVKDKEQFKNFVNLVEAIVAFHKSKGGN